MSKPHTLAELALTTAYADRQPFDGRSERVLQEIRRNLVHRLRNHLPLFEGILGFDDTVIPQLVGALLAQQHFILLGLRGQAKSRILRAISSLLDEEIPSIAGLEIFDDPFNPISSEGLHLLEVHGLNLPIRWVPRQARYIEKLATPDVTVADLIGDVDPIKAARLGVGLGDVRAMHFGLLPRANRGIFAVNELADLSPKVQVALFNILQEGDVQIKGYPIRLELDVLLVFSANPEDYTARGKIVTPLKDRIGAEIRTHYPKTLELGIDITAQEAYVQPDVLVPDYIRRWVEEIAFQAREDNRVDKLSGVSQRLPIALLELAAAAAERRSLIYGQQAVVRVHDVYAGLPAITGKLELEYEGEMKGAENIARDLLRKAAGQVYSHYIHQEHPALEKWFAGGQVFRIVANQDPAETLAQLAQIPGVLDLAAHLPSTAANEVTHRVAAAEFVLEGLYGRRKLARAEESYVAETETPRRTAGRWN